MTRPVPARRELQTLVGARALSVLGDQVARVALTALVLDRSGSALLAALAFAMTFLPALLGTTLLSGVSDRWPRRRVLVVGDLARATLVALLVLPGLPVPALLLLATLLPVLDGPWSAARGALLRTVAEDDGEYQRATAVDETLSQAGQVGGYVAGGVLVALLGTGPSLLLDAASFALSGALLQLLLQARPPADRRPGSGLSVADSVVGWRVALSGPCRLPVLLTWATVAAVVTPEALALPWSRELGSGAAGTAALLAANPVGAVAGLLLLRRTPPELAQRLLVPGSVAALVPLLVCAARPPVAAAVGLVLLSGVGATSSTVARIRFAGLVADAQRGRAFAAAGTGMLVAQGLGVLLAGLLADRFGTAVALAATGAVGLVLVGGVVGLSAPRSLAAPPLRRLSPPSRGGSPARCDGCLASHP